ncbi:MAG: hypothetical protein ACRYGI_11300 [Janthinobacterium lividum]
MLSDELRTSTLWMKITPRWARPGTRSLAPYDQRTALGPQTNNWQFMRDNRRSNRVFTSQNEIVDDCRYVWNNLEPPCPLARAKDVGDTGVVPGLPAAVEATTPA